MAKLQQQKLYGTVTVGERGQVVVPVKVRKLLRIKPADKLVVLANQGMIGLIPLNQFNSFINRFTRFMGDITRFREQVRTEK